jgi:Uma2 family endonuclease
MPGRDDVRAAGPGVKLTYDDFLLFPDDGKRHELIDGEHYVTPSPNIGHQRILGRLYLLVGNWLESHPVGQVFFAPLDVVFSQFDVVEPDLLYLSNERAAEVLTTEHARGVPELVVEVASKSTRRRDETIKRELYERAGVTEYWIVDPKRQVVGVYSRLASGEGADARRFGRPIELSRAAGDVLKTPLLPGLDLPLVGIFKE